MGLLVYIFSLVIMAYIITTFFNSLPTIAHVHVDFVVFLNWTLAPGGCISIATFSLISY